MTIIAHITYLADGRETDLGDHVFVALPRAGEQIIVETKHTSMQATVEMVVHHPRREGGPDREPTVVLRVSKVAA